VDRHVVDVPQIDAPDAVADRRLHQPEIPLPRLEQVRRQQRVERRAGQADAERAERHVLPRLAATPLWPAIRTTGWAFFAVAVFVSVRMSATDFIYFQF
jgi:hypothetical protein